MDIIKNTQTKFNREMKSPSNNPKNAILIATKISWFTVHITA